MLVRGQEVPHICILLYAGEAQEWVRMMLTTVGRGGDGQKIRDEILNIMHRNKIPEKKVGHYRHAWSHPQPNGMHLVTAAA